MEIDYLILTNLYATNKLEYNYAINKFVSSLKNEYDLSAEYLLLLTKFIEQTLDLSLPGYICPISGDKLRNYYLIVNYELITINVISKSKISIEQVESVILNAKIKHNLMFDIPIKINIVQSIPCKYVLNYPNVGGRI